MKRETKWLLCVCVCVLPPKTSILLNNSNRLAVWCSGTRIAIAIKLQPWSGQMHAVNHQRCLNIIDTLFDVFRKGSIKKWNINGLVTCHECAVLIVQPFGLWLMVETAQECILPSLFSLSLSVHMSMFICIVVFLPFPFAPLSSCCRYSRISLGHPFLSTNLISSKS